MEELIKSNGSTFKNHVAKTVWEFGGQKNFTRLLASKGAVLSRQAIYNWCATGTIPHKYRNVVARVIQDYPSTSSDHKAFLACIRKQGTPNSSSVFPNEPLAQWVEAQGGISKIVKRANVGIAEENKDAVCAEDKDKKWTYVMVHNWLKRGRVSDNFRIHMEYIFGCPREIMGPEQKPKDFRRELTPADILG